MSKHPGQVGSEMAKTPKVSLAIQWYGARMLQSSLIDKDTLIDKALTLYAQCNEAGELETARKTLELMMKAGGLLEKNPVKVPQSKVRHEDKDAPFQEYTEQVKEQALQESLEKKIPSKTEKSPEELLSEGMLDYFNKMDSGGTIQ